MKWWDDLWLNEGFASWMEKKLTDEFNPSMKVWVRNRAEKEKAMAKDALRTAHPVQQPIADEAQALAAFDDITYLKGLSLVRMLEAYLGEAEFRDGLRRYMAQACLFERDECGFVGGARGRIEQTDRGDRAGIQPEAGDSSHSRVDTMCGEQARGDAAAGPLCAQRSLRRPAKLAGAGRARPPWRQPVHRIPSLSAPSRRCSCSTAATGRSKPTSATSATTGCTTMTPI